MKITLDIPDDKVSLVVKAFGLNDDSLYPTPADKKAGFIQILVNFIRNQVKNQSAREFKDLQATETYNITGA